MSILIIILILFVVWIIITYNKFVTMQKWVEESWSQIDVQLKRRYDLIPNLVSVVKGYAQYEQETLEKVIKARNELLKANTNQDRDSIIKENETLSEDLRGIFALNESYPELKANENFLNLQQTLITTENKIAYARQLYNSTIVSYNTKINLFPNNIIANIFGFKEKDFLKTAEEERENVKVDLN